MIDKKYQVFISSTYTDLKEERRRVLDILLMADCIPAGMEAFVATDDEQFEVIKKVIDLCDYYILIIGKRYGSVNQSTGKSYTEMEYHYAREQGIPVLVFAIDDTADLPEEKVECDQEKDEKLAAFKKEAMENRLASIWKDLNDLAGQIAIAIMRAKMENPRPGWQRAVDFDEASLRREIMESQDEAKELRLKLSEVESELRQLTTQTDLAFEECGFVLEYNYFGYDREKVNAKKEVDLTDIFVVIATEMMDVNLTEVRVKDAVKEQILGTERTYYLSDTQIIKKILNQLRALGLVYSNWGKENSKLYWGLTTKGRKVRDDMILIRAKASDNEDEQKIK